MNESLNSKGDCVRPRNIPWDGS